MGQIAAQQKRQSLGSVGTLMLAFCACAGPSGTREIVMHRRLHAPSRAASAQGCATSVAGHPHLFASPQAPQCSRHQQQGAHQVAACVHGALDGPVPLAAEGAARSTRPARGALTACRALGGSYASNGSSNQDAARAAAALQESLAQKFFSRE